MAINDLSAPAASRNEGKPNRRGTRVTTAIGVFVSVVLVWWLIRGLDIAGLREAWGSVSPVAVLAALGILYVSLPFRALQWQWLLGKPANVSFVAGLRAICVGHLGNLVLPARGGEVVRTYSLSRETGLSFSGVLPSTLLARVLDIPPVIGLVIVSVYLGLPDAIQLNALAPGAASSSISASAILMRLTVLVLVMTVLVAIAYSLRDRILRLSTMLASRLPGRLGVKFVSISTDLITAIRVAGQTRQALGALVLSAACWLVFALSPVPLLLAFGFTVDQAMFVGVVQVVLTSFAFILPVPGGIGTFHVLCVAALYACVPEVERDTAVAYAIVAHAIGVLGPAVPGVVLISMGAFGTPRPGPKPLSTDDNWSAH